MSISSLESREKLDEIRETLKKNKRKKTYSKPKSLTFTAFDVETATSSQDSICQIGIVRVEKGKVVKSISRLIRPIGNRYSAMNIRIHRITPERTMDEPELDAFWDDLKPYFEGQNIVAHNISFDWSALCKSLAHYYIEPPNPSKKIDTMQLYGKRGLKELCIENNIELNHHDALSDANAAAQLYIKHITK